MNNGQLLAMGDRIERGRAWVWLEIYACLEVLKSSTRADHYFLY
jgi:hypothetical protein